jgi:hypothetical protein
LPQALASLAAAHRPLLAQYSSYLANVLDHLEGFSDSQLHQVFAMFAALTAVQPAAGASSSSSGAGEPPSPSLLSSSHSLKDALPQCSHMPRVIEKSCFTASQAGRLSS